MKKSSFLSPEKIIEDLNISKGETVLDFGAGPGFWAIPIAQKIGAGGQVFVTDPKTANLLVLKDKATRAGLENITYLEASYHSDKLPLNTKVDWIIFSNVLSYSNARERLLLATKKLAKDGTRLVIVDWQEGSIMGPEKAEKINVEEIILIAKKAGFEFKKLLDAGAQHVGLYFEHVGY